MLEKDNSITRAAVALLKDLFRCHLQPHARQVAYMANSHWYLRWNSRLASQCTEPAKLQKQRDIQEQQKGSQQLGKGKQRTQNQQNRVKELTKEKHGLQKLRNETNGQIKQQSGKEVHQEGTVNLYKEHHRVVSDFQEMQELTKKNHDKQIETENNQQYDKVHAVRGGMKQEPRSPDRKVTPPSCDNTSFVSEVCRSSALHVAKVSHHQHITDG